MVENEPFFFFLVCLFSLYFHKHNYQIFRRRDVCVCERVYMWVYVCQGMYVYGVCVCVTVIMCVCLFIYSETVPSQSLSCSEG